jgi:hypothetical protein
VVILSFSASPGLSYPQNSLRFGLIDIKPVVITENAKLGNIRLKVTKTQLKHTKPVSTFEELVAADNAAVFVAISIPEKFKLPDLIKIFTSASVKHFEEDVELQQEIKNMKRTDRRGHFFNFISFMKQRFEKERDTLLDVEAKRFLMSNLPLTFYNKFTVYEDIFYEFLKITQDIVRSHEFVARHARSSQMYEKRISTMQHVLDPLINKFDECSYSCMCLKKYVTIWNAESLDDLNWPKFLDIEKIELAEFERLSTEFTVRLREMKLMLFEYTQNVACKIGDTPDFTDKMIRNILVMPSNSLNGALGH